ncbi:acyl-CoA dehydratase activase [Methanospirillum lacunae]|uniref:2-hydroxyglutaryl-CoA dehydratase n=1 Tax=Methanospirillum lacunae TaxID=668570 RepID=A0A2V2MV66_9EURY|nr:acyl-CoA dehydratase activase [Methanospirillum lacunae]PWR71269.1 2-hydroxyglutaryl-CoA dehydratase [Methanospirillum lacunae]
MTEDDNINQKVAAGVDIGSLTTKSVLISDGAVIGSCIIPTGIFPEKSGLEALEKAMESIGCAGKKPTYTVATGYGRISAPYADETVTEITCHAKGAYSINQATRTVIDMGGQDCKVIRIDNSGNVSDFIMNDKCAAGTGRFLEVIASVFRVKLENLGPMALKAEDIVPISSTCTVFAESEVVSLLARGEKPENILRGVHHAIAHRITGMTIRVGVEDAILFSGGVAKNEGMRRALADAFNKPIIVPNFDPQIIGALGAARIAEKKVSRDAS